MNKRLERKTINLNLGTFGFHSTIPTNATITGVLVSVEWKVSTTASIATLGGRTFVNGSGVGTELVNAAEPLTETTQSFTVSGLTRAQLLDGAGSRSRYGNGERKVRRLPVMFATTDRPET